MMSSLQARRRGPVLDGGHEEETHRWRRVRPGRLKPLRATSSVECDAGDFDRIAGPTGGDAVRERGAAVVERLEAGDPVINRTLLLGIDLIWPAARRPARPGPGCLDASLGTRAVCVICHRRGADHLFKPIPEPMFPKRPKAHAPDGTLSGGRGAAKGGKVKAEGKGAKAKKGRPELVVVGRGRGPGESAADAVAA